MDYCKNIQQDCSLTRNSEHESIQEINIASSLNSVRNGSLTSILRLWTNTSIIWKWRHSWHNARLWNQSARKQVLKSLWKKKSLCDYICYTRSTDNTQGFLLISPHFFFYFSHSFFLCYEEILLNISLHYALKLTVQWRKVQSSDELIELTIRLPKQTH